MRCVLDRRRIFPEHFLLKHYCFRHPVQARGGYRAIERLDPEERAIGAHVHYDKYSREGDFICDRGI